MPSTSDPDETTNTTEPTVAGVLLAAGVGSRFDGGNKLLATVDGTPLVRVAAATLCRSSVDSVVVVVGHEADRIRTVLEELPVTIVENPAYGDGQSTSVAVGLDALAESVDYALFALGDMPHVAVETIDRLVATAREGGESVKRTENAESVAAIVVPTFESQRGNPVVFHRILFDALAAVDGDRGGRALFDDASVTRVAVDDAGILRDIDTREDLDETE